jgi:D-glycero-alpha-D-manno-heptose-7-phosphate kinase
VKPILSCVYVKSPLRLSLSGGGTDFVEYFESAGGTTITAAALRYFVNIHIRRLNHLYDEKFRLEYYEVEHCNEVHEIRNDIIRAVLTYLNWKDPIYISVMSDLPSSSGLGSSSSFAAGLLLGLHRLSGLPIPDAFELARMAIAVELDILARPMGIQDCLPSIFGGLSVFDLESKFSFTQRAVPLAPLQRLAYEGKLFLVWIGGQRDSGSVLSTQRAGIGAKRHLYDSIKRLSARFGRELLDIPSSSEFGTLLMDVVNSSQSLKVELDERILPSNVDSLLSELKGKGVDAVRIVGAGGGGCLLCVCNSDVFSTIDTNLKKIPLIFSTEGARIVYEES